MNYKNSSNEQNISKKRWIAKGFIFLAAFLSMIFSIYLFYSGDTQKGVFVGIWVPSILSAGTLIMAGHSE